MKKSVKPKPEPTAESRAFAAAWKSSGKTQEEVGEVVGLTAGNVSQWINGTRKIPAAHAPALGAYLSIAPEAISLSYRKIQQKAAAVSGGVGLVASADPAIDQELMIARLQNDVTALNYALGAIIATMTFHRPAEARDAAAAIRRSAPAKFRDHGLLKQLLATMDKM